MVHVCVKEPTQEVCSKPKETYQTKSLQVFRYLQEKFRLLANLRTIISIFRTDVRHLCNMLKDNLSDILLINENSLLQMLLLHSFPKKSKEILFYKSHLVAIIWYQCCLEALQ